MAPSLRWGLVATVLAPVEDTLRFCAHHLRAGAERIYVYLDDPDAEVFAILNAHARITAVRCDDVHWTRLCEKRPVRHQVRQSRNANHAYSAASDLDWLIHMDVDEFLLSDGAVGDHLAQVAADALCARVRPLEAMAGQPGLFKRAVPKGRDYNQIMARLYPDWGAQIKGGFLSHVQGKLFVRLGVPDLRLKIHNAVVGEAMNPRLVPLPGVDLAHFHAPSWDRFRTGFQYRLAHGSYRADLGPNRPRERGGVTLHDVMSAIVAEGGEAALHDFYREVCTATPKLVDALDQHGLLKRADLHLSDAVDEHFPGCV